MQPNPEPILSAGVQPLTERAVPSLDADQLATFDKTSIHAAVVLAFDVQRADEKLVSLEGSLLLGADFGGDKGVIRLFKIVAGKPVVQAGYADDIQGNLGEGYLDSFKRAAVYADAENIPFGISWGAPLNGTQPLYHPKAEIFLREIAEQYDNDFKNISTRITVINDGPAGALSGAVQAYRQFGSHNTIFIINGGGINSSVVTGGQLYSDESGHVEAQPVLNTYGQTTACGVFGAQYVCLERLGANKAGIEAQWEAKTGNYMRARNIEDEYKAGNGFAGDLYEHSAWVVAHLIIGVAQSFGLDLNDPQTAVVAHGGAFKFPYYGARLQQILTAHVGAQPQLILAKDYVSSESNACLDGAAIAAIYAA